MFSVFNNGVLLQWGFLNDISTPYSYTFPVAYRYNPGFIVQAGEMNYDNQLSRYATSWQLRQSNGQQNFSFVAIGY